MTSRAFRGLWRHPVEGLLAESGESRATATHHGKTDGSFAAGIHPFAGRAAAA